jgi:hypothetical protein
MRIKILGKNVLENREGEDKYRWKEGHAPLLPPLSKVGREASPVGYNLVVEIVCALRLPRIAAHRYE